MSTARQRLSQFKEAFGIVAKKSLGQNFLVSDVVIERIINKVKYYQPEVLVEVGPGTGALTYFLRQLPVQFKVIELDTALAKYWRDQGLDVVEADALQMDWAPLCPPGVVKVFVSNLPYQISSSIVIDRSLDLNGFDYMVLMFQKEVAQRLVAKPQTENYSMLSVISQAFWKMETVTEAGPRDFEPPPRVASRVLAFSKKKTVIANPKAFLVFVKMAFAQRRKLLKKNLAILYSQKGIAEEQLVSWLAEMGFKETARAEELTVDQFVTLYKKFGFEV